MAFMSNIPLVVRAEFKHPMSKRDPYLLNLNPVPGLGSIFGNLYLKEFRSEEPVASKVDHTMINLGWHVMKKQYNIPGQQ